MSDFTLAIAIQNLAWGLVQAYAGALVVRYGYRPLLLGGVTLYITGLTLLALAQGKASVIFGSFSGVSASITASRLSVSAVYWWYTCLPMPSSQGGVRSEPASSEL